MKRSVCMSLLCAISLFAGAKGSKDFKIEPRDRAIIEVFEKRDLYYPKGSEAYQKNFIWLATLTKDLPGSITEKIHHLKVNGINNPWRKETVNLMYLSLVNGN